MPHAGKEIVFEGIGVSHGIAIGPAYLVAVERPPFPKEKIEKNQTLAEVARFDAAVAHAENDLRTLTERSTALPAAAAEEVGHILGAHLAMLSGSRLVRGVRARIEKDQLNAEWALDEEMAALATQFRALKDKYIAARIDDVAAVGNRVLRALMNLPYLSLDAVPSGGIVLADDISPADAAQLDPARIAGLASVRGGATGHTAVMARSLGLPAVLGLPEKILECPAGVAAIIDAVAGKIILCPTPATRQQYEDKRLGLSDDKKKLADIARLPATTKDGMEIVLRANLELPRDLDGVLAAGAAGIGLFRTEFMFMNRPRLPSEDEQYDVLSEVVRKMAGAPVTFRTLDIGGDKLAEALGPRLTAAANPALGLRAIRLSLKEPQLLRDQFRAMLRAAALGPARVLLPMVTTVNEAEAARKIFRQCYRDLQDEGAAVPADIPALGVMIEIPAAALAADSLAVIADFFALGTNDLVQYTVAIDRSNDQVADLYNPLNPAVLRLMEFAIEAATRAGIPISLCGEMGADPAYTPLLLGLGIREFSIGAASLPRIKQRIRALDLAAAKAHAEEVMREMNPDQVIRIVQAYSK